MGRHGLAAAHIQKLHIQRGQRTLSKEKRTSSSLDLEVQHVKKRWTDSWQQWKKAHVWGPGEASRSGCSGTVIVLEVGILEAGYPLWIEGICS